MAAAAALMAAAAEEMTAEVAMAAVAEVAAAAEPPWTLHALLVVAARAAAGGSWGTARRGGVLRGGGEATSAGLGEARPLAPAPWPLGVPLPLPSLPPLLLSPEPCPSAKAPAASCLGVVAFFLLGLLAALLLAGSHPSAMARERLPQAAGDGTVDSAVLALGPVPAASVAFTASGHAAESAPPLAEALRPFIDFGGRAAAAPAAAGFA